MRIESLVGLAKFFADREEIEFSVMLNTEEGCLFAIGMASKSVSDEALESVIAEEIEKKGFCEKAVKVLVLNDRHPSLMKYVLKNGIPVFCRDEKVMGEWYMRFMKVENNASEKTGGIFGNLMLSGGY